MLKYANDCTIRPNHNRSNRKMATRTSTKQRWNLYVEKKMRRQIERLARNEERSPSDLVRILLAEALEARRGAQ